jgi:S-adenosylmethionine decarboxylase
MKNLCPKIFRQRMIIEGTCDININKNIIAKYMSNLSKLLKMRAVWGPKVRLNPDYGFSAYIYWEESGCHFYYWKKPFPFFSVDIYTCKKFSSKTAVNYTKKFFKSKKIVFKNV